MRYITLPADAHVYKLPCAVRKARGFFFSTRVQDAVFRGTRKRIFDEGSVMSAEPVTLAGGPYDNEMGFSGRCAVSGVPMGGASIPYASSVVR